MKLYDQYHLPTSIAEALALLARYQGRARVVAGGTDLLVDLQGEYHEGSRPHLAALVDVTQIAGANRIAERERWIEIGCAATHTQIMESPLVQARATALAEACAVVGGPQVRNVATLAGNVAHALPAADGTVALMALGAEAEIARLGGEENRDGADTGREAERRVRREWVVLERLFRGPGESAVDSTREVMTGLRLRPTGAHEGSAFSRIMRPQGVALPILGMAARVRAEGEFIAEAAISAGPVAPVPFRAAATEAFLRGREVSAVTLREAGEILRGEVRPRTSAHRATREYREELVPELFAETLRKAWERARATK